MNDIGFLSAPPESTAARQMFDEDLADHGFVMNVSRLWAYQPDANRALFDLLAQVNGTAGLTLRERGVLVAACAATLGDSYCSLAWGVRLSEEADPDIAAAVIAGTDEGLTPAEAAMARWARTVVRNPNGTTAADVQALRDAGFDDARIFAMTVWVSLRLAFSTVNDALGARPDAEFRRTAPAVLQHAVSYGRPIADD